MSDTAKSNTRFWLIMAALLVVTMVIIGGAGSDGPPYDPDSVNPDGARGIVEVLRDGRIGADVVIRSSTPRPDDTAALMLQDRLNQEDTFALTTWVRNGGVLVVADSDSAFSQPRTGILGGTLIDGTVTPEECTIEALDQVGELDLPFSHLLDPQGGDVCFGTSQAAFIVATPEGAGTIVSIGGPNVFTNASLDEADAAVLATALLAPEPGTARVTFLGPSPLPLGEDGIDGGISPRVTSAIYQALAAFLIYALFRMRRLGRVVAEPVPVVIEGSELTLQAGVLSERAQDPASAAEVIRTDFIARAHRSLGVPRDPAPGDGPAPMLVEVIANQTPFDTDGVRSALTAAVGTEDDLVSVAQQLSAMDAALSGESKSGDSKSGATAR